MAPLNSPFSELTTFKIRIFDLYSYFSDVQLSFERLVVLIRGNSSLQSRVLLVSAATIL